MLFAFNFPIVLPRAYTPEFGSLIADIAAGNPGKACYKCFNSHVCAKLKVMFLVRRPYLVPESPWSWIHYVVMQSFSNGSLVYLVALNSVVLVICGVMYFDRNYLSLDCSLFISCVSENFPQAEIPAVLKYLHGCKHFAPRGRWVVASTGKHICMYVSLHSS